MDMRPGLRLGPYEILEPLGSGGMGEVWKARDTRLDRLVAVKVLQGEWAAQEEGLERFRQEAKAVAALNHPNVLGLFDIGAEGGLPFAVMELLVGETLRQRLIRGPLPADAALDLGIQVAQGLAAAHAKRIIHRDLKPENLWITDEGRVKILDFGLAKQTGEVDAEAPTAAVGAATQPGFVMGTVGYMSPEQIRGERVDPRSDLFALGAVLWEAVAGHKAFGRTSAAASLSAILVEDPGDLAQASRGVPPAFAALVGKCLEKERDARISSAKELAEALEALRATPTTSPRRDGPSLAVLPFLNLSASKDQDYFSDGITEEILAALARLKGLKVAARTSSFAFKGKEEDARRIGEALGVAHLLEGSVRVAGGKLRVTARLISAEDGCQLWSNRFDRALEDVFEVQDEIAHAIASALEVNLLQVGDGRLVPSATQDPEAYDLYLRGRAFYNQRLTTQAIECFEAAIARDEGFAQAHTGLADAFASYGFYGGIPTLEAYARAKAAAETARRLAPDAAEPHVSLGIIEHYYGWDFEKEEAELREAIRLNPNLAAAHYWMGLLFTLRAMPERGMPFAQRAADLDPLNPSVHCGMVGVHLLARRFEEALKVVDRIRRMDPRAILPIYMRAQACLIGGRSDDAIAFLEQAQDHPGGRSSRIRSILGAAYADAGRVEDARAVLKDLRDEAHASYVAPLHLAMIEAYLGDMDAAFNSLSQAIDERNALAWFDIQFEPVLDLIRSDPRFPSLVKRLGRHSKADIP